MATKSACSSRKESFRQPWYSAPKDDVKLRPCLQCGRSFRTKRSKRICAECSARRSQEE